MMLSQNTRQATSTTRQGNCLKSLQLYHSIHARGERVEDIIKDAEAGVQDEDLDEVTRTKGASFAQTDGAMSEKLEDGELEEEPKSTQTYTNKNSKEKVQVRRTGRGFANVVDTSPGNLKLACTTTRTKRYYLTRG